MIRITNDSLIIEIKSNSPLTSLVQIQQALADALLFRDSSSNGERVDMMIWGVSYLQGELLFTERQTDALEQSKDKELIAAMRA